MRPVATFPLLAVIAALAISAPGLAVQPDKSSHENMQGMDHRSTSASATQDTQVHRGQGTVTEVDAKAGKIGIKHAPIQSLGWPAMTMDFKVADKAALKQIKTGRPIAFEMRAAGQGQYLITKITPASN